MIGADGMSPERANESVGSEIEWAADKMTDEEIRDGRTIDHLNISISKLETAKKMIENRHEPRAVIKGEMWQQKLEISQAIETLQKTLLIMDGKR
jgi:hypothetical protein